MLRISFKWCAGENFCLVNVIIMEKTCDEHFEIVMIKLFKLCFSIHVITGKNDD